MLEKRRTAVNVYESSTLTIRDFWKDIENGNKENAIRDEILKGEI